MTRTSSLSPDYFEQMFAGNQDPWSFETSAYEAAKYDTTIAALEGRLYTSGLEIGCANGVLTKRLSRHCLRLLAVDVSETALRQASERCSDDANVSFGLMTFPQQAPSDDFDLVILSEVAYYWSDSDLKQAADWIAQHLCKGGDLMLVHWTGETDYPQTGDAAVKALRTGLPFFSMVTAQRHEKYRLDLWRNT